MPKTPNKMFDLQARTAEVQQQAHAKSGRLEVVHTLRTMDIVQGHDGLELDNHRPLDQVVDGVLPNDRTVIQDHDTVLLRHRNACLAKLVRQRVLINHLEKSRPKRIGSSQHASNDHLGKAVQFGHISVQERLSARIENASADRRHAFGATTEPRRHLDGVAMQPKTAHRRASLDRAAGVMHADQGLGATAAKRRIAAGSCAAASSLGQSSGGLPCASIPANTE
jgi:hypothetical protein